MSKISIEEMKKYSINKRTIVNGTLIATALLVLYAIQIINLECAICSRQIMNFSNALMVIIVIFVLPLSIEKRKE